VFWVDGQTVVDASRLDLLDRCRHFQEFRYAQVGSGKASGGESILIPPYTKSGLSILWGRCGDGILKIFSQSSPAMYIGKKGFPLLLSVG
jgi:hypothetical protein